MSKVEESRIENGGDIRREYRLSDLGKGVRGKYYDNYRRSHNIALLNPEVARAFPADEAVNRHCRD